jgi:hypothetical protein
MLDQQTIGDLTKIKSSNPRSPISTAIYSVPASIDYATRTAKILARRLTRPVYVGCSVDVQSMGVTADEEMEGFTKMIREIIERSAG